MTRPELLAPAGNPECAVAAIQNGADAVYLGLKQGSARAGADNFTWNELEETLKYAHVRDCRVYLALNTLFSDSELAQATEDALGAANLGIDALIVQDMGLARRLLTLRAEGILPGATQIHASTQMSVATKEGALFLKEQGFDRLITSRELSLTELTELCRADLPVECFTHGALCMSYSGQCLLSSFIGGRSGNRGVCAQPCRMAYHLDPTKQSGYLLSPKDFCALPLLDRLVDTGVASLKIEGRLKAPEYAALTTGIYRKALDYVVQDIFPDYRDGGEMAEDIRRLELMFSRGHFTKGYLEGKIPHEDITYNNPGRKGLAIGTVTEPHRMLPRPGNLPGGLQTYELPVNLTRDVTPGDGITVLDKEEKPYCGGTVNRADGSLLTVVGAAPARNSGEKLPGTVYLTHSPAFTEEIRRTYAPGMERPRVGVKFSFTAHAGSPAILTVEDNRGNKVCVESQEPVAPAKNAPTDKGRIESQLSKLGGTPYFVEDIEIQVDPDIFLPVSALNSLRRESLTSLATCHEHKQPEGIAKYISPTGKPGLTPVHKGRTTTLYFYREAIFLHTSPEALARFSPYLIYVPYKLWRKPEDVTCALNKAHQAGAKLIATFPLLTLGETKKELTDLLPYILQTADGVQLTNPGDIRLLSAPLPKEDFLVCGDLSLNVTNTEAARFFQNAGVQILTLSPEAVRDGVAPSQAPTGMLFEEIQEGPVPLMRTRHCMIREGKPHCGRCTRENSAYTLTDSHGAVYTILPEPEDCQNMILSPEPFPTQPNRSASAFLQRINIVKENNP